ncbi:MAG: IS1380 family transposase, partial [Planctomycetes bacterium]|nr:IS1380 family transposase [Planctomycetota bacterium]
MNTECTAEQLKFHGLGRRVVVGQFDGGKISSDSGGLLLREVEQRTHILKRLAGCFTDHRGAGQIEHSLESLIKQRVMGLALGYEDLNDHDALRHDPLLALLSDKQDLSGKARKRDQDKGCALAGKSTLNRLELTPLDANTASRYKKIVANPEAMDDLLVDLFLAAYDSPPEEIILDVDATDDPLHGNQEGRFFHGYYRSYCYLPLYIFCDEHLLCARLRTADQDGAAGTVDELAGMIERIRLSWPQTRIIVRGDGGFCREDLMAWCEAHTVDYVLGIPKNSRLKAIIAEEMAQAKSQYEATEHAARVFKDFRYQTLESWSCERRVIGKAEHLSKGENPR